MTTSITITFDHVAQLVAELKPRVQMAIDKTAFDLEAEAKRSIMEAKGGGRTYMHPQPAPHQASAPGNAPNNWTGTLAAGIQAKPHTGDLQAEVHSNAAHSLYLEMGTSKMAPRRFMVPATKKMAPNLQKAVASALGI